MGAKRKGLCQGCFARKNMELVSTTGEAAAGGITARLQSEQILSGIDVGTLHRDAPGTPMFQCVPGVGPMMQGGSEQVQQGAGSLLALMMAAAPDGAQQQPVKRPREVIGIDDSEEELTAEQDVALQNVDRQVASASQGTEGIPAPSTEASNTLTVQESQ
jgi:hypothetical protein